MDACVCVDVWEMYLHSSAHIPSGTEGLGKQTGKKGTYSLAIVRLFFCFVFFFSFTEV